MMTLRKALAFLKRDYRIESSYRVAFALQLGMTVFPIFSFYFIAKLVGGSSTVHLDRYGGQYFPFVLIGLAMSQYMHWALRTFANSVRRAQTTGVFEAIVSTRSSVHTVILLSSLYSFLATTIHVAIVFGVGGAVLGVDFGNANILSALLSLVLTMLAFAGIGIASGALLVLLKKGDPIEIIVGSASSLLGGAFFPISVMPEWLQPVSRVLPMTYSLESLRLAILEGYSIDRLWMPLGVLAIMAAVLLPAGVRVFAWAVERGRRDGTLAHY